MKSTQLCVVVLAGVALACASKPTPITISGDSGARASLAGKWAGEYNSPATGRSGSIVFNLSPSGDSASGDVVMVPRGYGRPLIPYGNASNTAIGATQTGGNSQVLTIKLVRVAGDTVSGVLDAYRDPECDCPVQTTFTGRINRDAIDGTFTTRGAQSNAGQTGTWRVKRTTR